MTESQTEVEVQEVYHVRVQEWLDTSQDVLLDEYLDREDQSQDWVQFQQNNWGLMCKLFEEAN